MQTNSRTPTEVLGLFSICLLLLSTLSFAVPPTSTAPVIPTTSATTPAKAVGKAAQATDSKTPTKPALPTAQQFQQQIKQQGTRIHQLEEANQEALTRNQELQLMNDNLAVQVQVLQSERSAQMFLYGAVTLAGGVLLGFFISSYIHTKRRRQW